jgi:hypothetical protein
MTKDMAQPGSRLSRRALLVGCAAGSAAGLLGPAAFAGENLSDLVRRADHVLRGKTTAALIEMRVHTQAYDRSYSMVYWSDDSGSETRTLVKILGPARFRGHGTLKLGARLSLYDPQSDRITLLSSSMLGDSWMGSHFTNDDLVKETDLAADYVAHLLGTSKQQIGGQPATVYRVSLAPKPSAPVAWDHIGLELYTQGALTIPTREDYFRRAGQTEPTRTMTLSEVKELGGRTVPTRLLMHVADKPGEFTQLDYEKITFDKAIPASKFTEQALRE